MTWEPPGGPPPPQSGWNPPPALAPSRAPWGRIALLGTYVGVLAIGVLIAIWQTSTMRTVPSRGAPQASGVGLGRLIFSDDFRDSGSGWTTQTLTSTTFAYTANGYAIRGHGNLHHFSGAPFSVPLSSVEVSVTATQSGGAAQGSGLGVACRRPTSEVGPSTLNRYEFLVVTGRRFFIERRDGLLSVATGPYILKEGTAPASPGAVALTIEALCSTFTDGRSTRLALFIDRHKVADFVDIHPGSPSGGWLASIEASTRASAPSTVTVSHFEERDLSIPTP